MLKNTISRGFGLIARIRFPRPVQNFINKRYIKHFGIDMSDFAHHSEYASLLELFTRRYVNAPSIEDGFISPCDGRIYGIGTSQSVDDKALAFSIKGKDYFIDDVLLDRPFERFDFVNIYLSPRDYHNYHAPCDMRVRSLRYIPADLFSVGRKALAKVPKLYARNERVVLECEDSQNRVFYMVFVGALNVGKMVFDFDPSVQTNAHGGGFYRRYESVNMHKGDMLGRFEMGSTILLIARAGDFCFDLDTDDTVRFGQHIAE